MSSGKWLPFCLGLNVLSTDTTKDAMKYKYSEMVQWNWCDEENFSIPGSFQIQCWKMLLMTTLMTPYRKIRRQSWK